VAGWIEKDSKGDTYISCTISPKLENSGQGGVKTQPQAESVDMLEDDPF
jgi:hypothetical protein